MSNIKSIGGNPIVLGLDGLKDEVKAGLNTPADIPGLAVGSATGILGDPETASWMGRTTAADGAALVEAVKGNTLRWNQQLNAIADKASGWIVNGSTVVAGSNSIEVTPTRKYGGIYYRYVSIIEGHKYLMTLDYIFPSVMNPAEFAVYTDSNMYFTDNFIFITGTTDWQHAGAIVTVLSGKASDSARIFFQDNRASDWDTWSIKNVMLFDLTAMFGAGNEPATVAEFEALFPEPYYPYDAGSLLPVRMEGVETVGFNLWDEEWETGGYGNTTGAKESRTDRIRSKNPTAVLPGTSYFFRCATSFDLYYYDGDGGFISHEYVSPSTSIPGAAFTTPSNAALVNFHVQPAYGSTYNHDICINIYDPSRNGTYEPHWSSERAIPVATYFPDGMRSAGTVRDELTETQAIHRVGTVDLGTLTWLYNSDTRLFNANLDDAVRNKNTGIRCSCAIYTAVEGYGVSGAINDPSVDKACSVGSSYQSSAQNLLIRDTSYTDPATFKAAMSGVLLYYELATPTTQPIDPPLPLSYRTDAGGTERVMVASGTTSAPPIFATRYPLDPADLAASIAPVDGPIAKTNHAVGELVMLGFALCKVTTAIARGEAITIGTNVTRTTVAAEIAALS